ncbi:MAG: EAL domain-containing protein [Lachnospiraceae bacterium]|nr:EAL domain-containing protein [Lachnospiraceae bacterium]
MGAFFLKPEMQEMNTDYLTGLCNRWGLNEVWQSLPQDVRVHCLYMDVDNFKLVNDIYGHAKGDELLVFISKLLQDTFQGQLIVRMGGDEFIVLCNGAHETSELEKKLVFLQEAISSGDFDKSVEKLLSFSIGVCYNHLAGEGLQVILEQADVAMYHVKKNGKGHFIVYDEIREQIEDERAIKDRALSGMVWKEIEILYRPVIYIQTSDVFAVETVIHWNFPDKGTIAEEKFMPIFKQYGIDVQMSSYALEEVCKQKRRWRSTNLDSMEIYVRLSGRYLLQSGSIQAIAQCLDKYGIRRDEIELCIEERDFGENGERMYAVVKGLMNAGFKVAINNFASASSLSVLQRVPSQLLKLDAKLLSEAEYNETGVSILRNVISLGRDLHCGIVAQGIENTAQVKMLADYGAQFGVGDFYGAPCDEPAFVEQYQDRLFFVRNQKPTVFPFAEHLLDDQRQHMGIFEGTGFAYTTGVVEGQHALCFPGGKVSENLVFLPKEVMYSDSYSICFWVNPDKAQSWTSIFYVTYKDGFMSLMPNSGHGDMFFRIKDDREPNEWHDIVCRRAVPGQWSFICATYDVITHIGKLYFNGLLVASRDNMPDLKVVNQVILGGDEYQDSFQGKLAGLEIYHYALSADKVEEKFEKYQGMPYYQGTDGRK